MLQGAQLVMAESGVGLGLLGPPPQGRSATMLPEVTLRWVNKSPTGSLAQGNFRLAAHLQTAAPAPASRGPPSAAVGGGPPSAAAAAACAFAELSFSCPVVATWVRALTLPSPRCVGLDK